MRFSNFTAELLVPQNATEVFIAINNVPGWWTEDFRGQSQKIDDEFEVIFFGDVHYSRQRIIESIAGQKVAWLVTESKLNFLKNKSEWTGTKIVFEIDKMANQTRIRFTHDGLVPETECYKDCSNGWNYYLQSLINLVTTGRGNPTKIGEKITSNDILIEFLKRITWLE